MAINLTVNGVTYEFPQEGEPEGTWGANVTAWALAVSQGMLQKAGGSFTLTGEVDFGATYGLKSVYFKSRSSDIAASGVVRLARADSVVWRNEANDGDLELSVNDSDELFFDSVKVMRSGAIVNADIAAGAAIAYSKLAALTASRALVSDGSGFVSASSVTATELGYVAGVTSAIQTQLDGKQASGNYITALTGDVVASGPGSASATISGLARSKLAAGTANHVVINDGSGAFSSEAQLAISRGGTGQSTKTAAFDALSPTTTKGDLVVSDGTNNIRFAVGSDGQVLTADSGETSGLGWSSPLTNPMSAVGDLIVGGESGAATRQAHPGAANRVLKSTSTTALGYAQIVDADVDASAAIAGSKIQAASASNAGVVNTSAQTFAGNKTLQGTNVFGLTSDTNNTHIFYSAVGTHSGGGTNDAIYSNSGVKIWNSVSSAWCGLVPRRGSNSTSTGAVCYTSLSGVQTEAFALDPAGHMVRGTGIYALGTVQGGNVNASCSRGDNGIRESARSSTSARDHLIFYNPNGEVGTISTSGSATAYNTSSDYRLKENITPVEYATSKLKALKPCQFNFIKSPEETITGFLAHEVQEIIPNAVTGEKDALKEDGTPQYQAIDHSKLVPLLTAALQEALERIEMLEAKLDT